MQRYSSRNEITPAERHKLRNLHLAPAAEPGELHHVADNRIANAFSSRQIIRLSTYLRESHLNYFA